MPWKTDKNGDKKYKVSIYAKEELPTWAEVYEEFYLKKQFLYDPNDPDHQHRDLYWPIQNKKYILATVCNQFNKMIFEDGLKTDLLKFINDNIGKNCVDTRFTCEILNRDCTDVRFTCEPINSTYEWKCVVNNKFVGINIAPPIYTIPFPNGKSNPFITSNHPRIDITENERPLCLFPIIKFDVNASNCNLYNPIPYDDYSSDDYNAIIEFMITQYKEYFEGEGIGWKDSDGKVIESDPMKRSCDGAGYDPAL